MKPDNENGWKIPSPQKKADKGSIVHKVLELLASKKLALQEGKPTFGNDEVRKTWDANSFDVEDAIDVAWHHYTQTLPTPFEWTHLDYKDVRKWTFAAMEFSNGLFNPLNRTIIRPEQYFDFTIREPWAHYRFETPNGEKIEGYLGLKGAIDLTVAVDGSVDTIELIDWKTGMRKDWASGQPKDWKKLRRDPQLRLYHYALSRLYPDVKYIIITIVWLQDGGPFSLDFGPQDLVETEKMIRERFNHIRECERPRRIRQDAVNRWKCERLCVFGLNNWQNTGTAVCDHIHEELLQIGLDKATLRFGKKDAYRSYGGGGGVTNREKEGV